MDYFTLNHRVAFYVPSTVAASKKISDRELEARTKEIASLLTSYFGGATIEKVQGFYKSKEGKYIVETVHKVISFTSDEDLAVHSQDLLRLAEQSCKQWSQESIGVEIDNKLIFID
jgi:hypothetical protein